MTEMYGSYSDEDLNYWERLPMNVQVLTSSAFGAWILRRDKRIKERESKTDMLDKIRAEISEAMDMEPAWKGQDNYIGGLQIACSIIDKYRQEG